MTYRPEPHQPSTFSNSSPIVDSQMIRSLLLQNCHSLRAISICSQDLLDSLQLEEFPRLKVVYLGQVTLNRPLIMAKQPLTGKAVTGKAMLGEGRRLEKVVMMQVRLGVGAWVSADQVTVHVSSASRRGLLAAVIAMDVGRVRIVPVCRNISPDRVISMIKGVL